MRRGRSSARWWRRVALSLLGVGGLVLMPAEARQAPGRAALEARVEAVRTALRSAPAAPSEPAAAGRSLAQWMNWPNWGNWNNWPNWGNWGNWLNR